MTELKEPASRADAGQPAPAAPQPSAAAPRARRIVSWLGVAVVVAGVIFGSNAFSVRDHLLGSAIPAPAAPVASRDAFQAIQGTSTTRTKLRSQAWFQEVATLSGAGTATTRPFGIADAAIQWRVRASCDSGRLVVRAPGQPKPIIDAACPKAAVGYANGAGTMRLGVEADGPWRAHVAQQIDAPLVEPPLRAMTAPGTTTVATGSFYNVEKTGRGMVTIYRQGDGRYSLRLARFFVTPTADLELRLSTGREPRTSKAYTSAHSRLVRRMDVTAGSLNFVVPQGIDPNTFNSVVIWCPATAQVYAAAGLRHTR